MVYLLIYLVLNCLMFWKIFCYYLYLYLWMISSDPNWRLSKQNLSCTMYHMMPFAKIIGPGPVQKGLKRNFHQLFFLFFHEFKGEKFQTSHQEKIIKAFIKHWIFLAPSQKKWLKMFVNHKLAVYNVYMEYENKKYNANYKIICGTPWVFTNTRIFYQRLIQY